MRAFRGSVSFRVGFREKDNRKQRFIRETQSGSPHRGFSFREGGTHDLSRLGCLCLIISVFILLFYRLYILFIQSYRIRQVFPCRIEFTNQLLFPFPMPFLQLLFSVDTVNKKVINFIIHQFLSIVSVRETFVDMELMLCHSPFEVSCHSCIKSGVVFIRENVDDSLERHDDKCVV